MTVESDDNDRISFLLQQDRNEAVEIIAPLRAEPWCCSRLVQDTGRFVVRHQEHLATLVGVRVLGRAGPLALWSRSVGIQLQGTVSSLAPPLADRLLVDVCLAETDERVPLLHQNVDVPQALSPMQVMFAKNRDEKLSLLLMSVVVQPLSAAPTVEVEIDEDEIANEPALDVLVVLVPVETLVAPELAALVVCVTPVVEVPSHSEGSSSSVAAGGAPAPLPPPTAPLPFLIATVACSLTWESLAASCLIAAS